MKLFCVKIGDAIGSFAPIELLEQTKSEIKQIISIKNVEDESLNKLKEDLLKGEILIATISDLEVTKLFNNNNNDDKEDNND